MHDLRLKVLRESGKTLSKKARSRPDSARASATHTPSHSPAHSRAGSRYASEEENNTDSDELDDNLTMSTLSNRSDDPSEDGRGGNWEQRLQDRIAELQDRKRSSAKGREAALATYTYLLRHHYARKQVAASAAGIMDALLKSVRGAGAGIEERRLAVEALGVTALTCPSDRAFDATADILRGVCRDADDDRTKAAAINTLAAGLIYGNGREAESPADEGAALDLLEFLLEIVRTDGESIGAENSADVVVAALQAWGYVATFVEDLDEQVDEALDQFVEQLDSTDVEVQTAAGADIALLFEASRRREDDGSGPYNLRYDPKKLVGRMSELAKQSSKSISRKDRRHLRTNFSSIVTSLETGKGPGYATSGRPSHNPHAARRKGGDPEEGFREFGYRDKLRVGDDVWTIETWSGSARIDMLRTMMGGGFQVHLVENEEVAGDVLGELGADGDEDDDEE